MANKNTWVQIEKIVLKPEERASNLPEDTKKVPLMMWVKGYFQADAHLGDIVTIKTLSGRSEQGLLVCENPVYKHDYGDFVPEILEINQMVKKLLFGDNNE